MMYVGTRINEFPRTSFKGGAGTPTALLGRWQRKFRLRAPLFDGCEYAWSYGLSHDTTRGQPLNMDSTAQPKISGTSPKPSFPTLRPQIPAFPHSCYRYQDQGLGAHLHNLHRTQEPAAFSSPTERNFQYNLNLLVDPQRCWVSWGARRTIRRGTGVKAFWSEDQAVGLSELHPTGCHEPSNRGPKNPMRKRVVP